MRIAIVNNNYQFGGAETVARQIFFGAKAAGHTAAFFIAATKTLPKDVDSLYPPMLSKVWHSRLNPLVEWAFPQAVWMEKSFRRLAESPFDVIHIHNFHGKYASIEALEFLSRRKPVIWTFHRFWGITGGCDHPGECERYLESCGECPRVKEWPICGVDNTREQHALKLKLFEPAPLTIVSPSRHLAAKVQGSPIGRRWPMVVIPNGVDPRGFSPARKQDAAFRQRLGLSSDVPVALVVNRDYRDPLKGFDIIRGALIEGNLPPAEFVFVGMNSTWAIQQLPKNLRTVDIGYVSSREKLSELCEAADIFLYASPGENFPCATIEAMCAGCCVVSTPTDGVLEQVEDGKSGFIAESFEPAALAKSLRQALGSTALRTECGAAARKRAEREFSEEKMVQDHLDLYAKVIRNFQATA